MTEDLYTPNDKKRVREILTKEQNNLCAITGLPMEKGQQILEHAHDSQMYVRGVTSRIMKNDIKKLDKSFLQENLVYDATSPTGLRWVTSNANHKAGDVAGTFTYQSNGTRNGVVVKIRDIIYRVNRVIWVLMRGDIPDDHIIDHLDGNPWNNNLNNLAMKSRRGNAHNLRLASDNKTGIKGVCLYTRKSTGKTQAIASVVAKDGKKVFKYFSVNKYGTEKALKLAHAWRLQKIQELNAEWAEYTERHIYD